MNNKLVPGKMYALTKNPIYLHSKYGYDIETRTYGWKFSKTTDSFTFCDMSIKDATYTNMFLANDNILYLKQERRYMLCYLFLYKNLELRLMREELLNFDNVEYIFLRDWKML